jgi:hypothetical protein
MYDVKYAGNVAAAGEGGREIQFFQATVVNNYVYNKFLSQLRKSSIYFTDG